MAKCTYVKRSGSICERRASGVRCEAHRGKRNKLRKKKRSGKKISHTPTMMRFYNVSNGRIISVPREDCRIRRSKGRGGDQVYAIVDGVRLFTFVPRGFEL